MKKVTILDGQTIQTLPVAKSLKKQGFYVVLLCDCKNSYGFRTKYADERIFVPSIKVSPEKFHAFFIPYLKDNEIDIVIPMNDYSAHFLSRNKNEVIEYCGLVIPDYDIFMSGYDKNRLMKVCSDNNFPHPKTSDLSAMHVEDAVKYVGFPALIKPNKTTGTRGFAFVRRTQDIYDRLPAIQKVYGNCHLQEFIPAGGKQYKVELFVYENNLINATVIHKIRFYPENGGSSCFGQTIEKSDVVQLCSEVLKTIGWVGFADFDLIEDPRDRIVKIMEINPRLPACIKAAFNSGVDFVQNIAQCSLGLQPAKYDYKPGIYFRYLALDLLWFLKSKKRFKVQPSWFKVLLSPKQFLQDGGFDDPIPFIYGTFDGVLKQLNPHFREEKKGILSPSA